jgi:hypothetical protein
MRELSDTRSLAEADVQERHKEDRLHLRQSQQLAYRSIQKNFTFWLCALSKFINDDETARRCKAQSNRHLLQIDTESALDLE